MTPGQISETVCYHSLAAVSSGSSSAVERQLPKLDVAGSIPVSRSIFLHHTHYRTKPAARRKPDRDGIA